jgi:hypothetical protein
LPLLTNGGLQDAGLIGVEGTGFLSSAITTPETIIAKQVLTKNLLKYTTNSAIKYITF